MGFRGCLIRVAVFLALSCLSMEARAQPLLGATVGISKQGAGHNDEPYLGPPFGGTSFTGVVTIDVPVGTTVSLGAEASLAAPISGQQRRRVAGGTAAFVSRHDDTIISMNLKVGTPFAGRVRTAAIGGFGVALRHTSRAGTFSQGGFSSSPARSPYSDSLTTLVLAATGGVEVAAHVSERVAILVGGRMHFLVDRDRQPFGVVRRGVSSIIVRLGAGVQVRF